MKTNELYWIELFELESHILNHLTACKQWAWLVLKCCLQIFVIYYNKYLLYIMGPIFSNLYMSAIENKVFNTINVPNIYLRYVDDRPLLTNRTNEINTIQDTFQNNPVLNFTQEIYINDKITFLCVLFDTSKIGRFITSTYKNPLPLIPAPSIPKVNLSSVIKEQSYKRLFPELSYYSPLVLPSLTNKKK